MVTLTSSLFQARPVSRLFGWLRDVLFGANLANSEQRGVGNGRPQVLDLVELRVASGRWSAGQIGTVIEDFGDDLLVEIADDQGRGVDFLDLPPVALAVVQQPDQMHLTGC